MHAPPHLGPRPVPAPRRPPRPPLHRPPRPHPRPPRATRPASPTSAAAPATSPPCSPTAGPPPTSPATTTPPRCSTRPSEHAGPTAGGGRLDFAHADARDLGARRAVRPDRLQRRPPVGARPRSTRFPAWLDALAPGGTFAFQVPGNFDAPSHALMRELADAPRWRGRLGGRAAPRRRRPRARRLPGPARRPRLRRRTSGRRRTSTSCRARTPSSTGSRAPACGPSSPPSPTTPRPATPSSPSTATCCARPTRRPVRHGLPVPPHLRRGPEGGLMLDRRRPCPARRPARLRGPPARLLHRRPRHDRDPQAARARGARGLLVPGRRRAAAPRHRERLPPRAKAHPGLRVTGIEAYAARLEAHGARVTWDADLPGHRRFYADDPVGNRLEFLETGRLRRQLEGPNRPRRDARQAGRHPARRTGACEARRTVVRSALAVAYQPRLRPPGRPGRARPDSPDAPRPPPSSAGGRPATTGRSARPCRPAPARTAGPASGRSRGS